MARRTIFEGCVPHWRRRASFCVVRLWHFARCGAAQTVRAWRQMLGSRALSVSRLGQGGGG